MDKKIRISKYIADAGYCSRRTAEELILSNQVSVNGKLINTPVFFVSANDEVSINGNKLNLKTQKQLWIYHKPKGVICSNKDPQGRKTVFEELPKNLPRLIMVGRLDFNTEGLLLFTNDGVLARQLELPSTQITRKYLCKVHGKFDFNIIKEKLQKEIIIKGIKYKISNFKLKKQLNNHAWFEILLKEGKNREIRNIMEHFRLKVARLIRTEFGEFKLANIKKKEIVEIPQSLLLNYLKDLP